MSLTTAVLLSAALEHAGAEPVPRSGTAAGAVIARKTGEEVRFIDVSDWQSVDLKQDLMSGDILRTNEVGQLAIVFSDRTQVRLGRNTSMVVKQITSETSSDTVLQLQSGTIWARAERGGPGVQVQTAAAAAAIRGTDWTMTVSGNDTSLTVLDGIVQLANPQGMVDVRAGEAAAATLGQAPRKVVIVESDDREQMRSTFHREKRSSVCRQQRSHLQTCAEMPIGFWRFHLRNVRPPTWSIWRKRSCRLKARQRQWGCLVRWSARSYHRPNGTG
nr:FecR family protein [Rhizobium sp. CFBP 8752]